MDKGEFTALGQALTGLVTCQSLLLQYLIKKRIINKDDISNAIDFLIDEFNRQNPKQAITLPMKQIRKSLEKNLPDFPPPPAENQRPKGNHPDWLRGIIEGGKK